MPSYILSEPYKQRVDRALSVVEGQPSQGGVTTIPTRFETLPQPASSKTFRVCTFTGSWSINASKTVTFKGSTNTPNTVSVVNLFFPISTGRTSETDCAIAKDGTAWYLIDVPFQTATAIFVSGTAVATYASGTTTRSVVTDVNISAFLNTANCGITVGRTLSTASVSVVTTTATAIFAQSTFTASFVRFGV